MIVHGMMQHEQSSPHQHGSLTGGFAIGPFAIEEVLELDPAAGGMLMLVEWRWFGGGRWSL